MEVQQEGNPSNINIIIGIRYFYYIFGKKVIKFYKNNIVFSYTLLLYRLPGAEMSPVKVGKNYPLFLMVIHYSFFFIFVTF